MEYTFSMENIFKDLPAFKSKGITELTVADKKVSRDKKSVLRLVQEIRKNCPDLFLSLTVDPVIIDTGLCSALQDIYVSLEVPLRGSEKNGALLFDKKFFSSKAKILNDSGIVWGFNLEYGKQPGDTFKAFRDRLDFAVSLYPNHIDFEQLESNGVTKSTGLYSSKDLDFSMGIAFACKSFYTCGRAVPWFLSVLQVLKIAPSAFFADFDEWQQCNNCSFITGFDLEKAGHLEIEKMQLNFLKQKFEEKHKMHLFECASDIVKINGGFSRLMGDNQESDIDLSYNPEELLSPYAMDIASFAENVPMEHNSIHLFFNKNGEADYR